MKPKYVKLICALICITVVITSVVLVRTELSGASSSILCYYNDRIWSLSGSYPVEVNTSGVYYVPLTLFVQLPDVNVRINNTLKTFIITHGELYLSFDTVSNFAANQDKIRTPISTYERHGERYVPAEIICAYLDLNFEKEVSPVSGDTAIRITDGNEENSFDTLLRRKHPGFYPEESTSVPDTTEITPSIIVPPTLTERTVYITIEDSPGMYTSSILDVLEEYGAKATFFIIGRMAENNIEALSAIAAEGHAIGLHTMNHDSSELTGGEAILADIEAGNELLSRVVKQKSRIWRAPEGSDKLPSLTAEVRDMLFAEGYIIWDGNVDIPATYSAKAAANAAVNGIRSSEVTVLRFTENENTAEALRQVLDFIKNNSEACEVRIISPAYDEYSDAARGAA